MNKQSIVGRKYIVVDEFDNEPVDCISTRAQARQLQQALGGAKKGYKIYQQFTVQREVR